MPTTSGRRVHLGEAQLLVAGRARNWARRSPSIKLDIELKYGKRQADYKLDSSEDRLFPELEASTFDFAISPLELYATWA